MPSKTEPSSAVYVGNVEESICGKAGSLALWIKEMRLEGEQITDSMMTWSRKHVLVALKPNITKAFIDGFSDEKKIEFSADKNTGLIIEEVKLSESTMIQNLRKVFGYFGKFSKSFLNEYDKLPDLNETLVDLIFDVLVSFKLVDSSKKEEARLLANFTGRNIKKSLRWNEAAFTKSPRSFEKKHPL